MSNDKVMLHGMVFYGYHGVSDAERERGQRFVVDLEVETSLRAAGQSDALADTVNYSDLYKLVKAVVEGPPARLLERVAESIARRVLDEHAVGAVRVRVKKPEVPIKGSVLAYAAVEVYRTRDQDVTRGS